MEPQPVVALVRLLAVVVVVVRIVVVVHGILAFTAVVVT